MDARPRTSRALRLVEPLPDGVYDSNTLGRDWIDGGTQNPTGTLDTATLGVGKFSYFCRLHPWMRGVFQIVP